MAPGESPERGSGGGDTGGTGERGVKQMQVSEWLLGGGRMGLTWTPSLPAIGLAGWRVWGSQGPCLRLSPAHSVGAFLKGR